MFPFDRTQNIKKPNVFEYFQGNQKERFGRKVLTLFHTERTVLCQFDSHCCFLFLCFYVFPENFKKIQYKFRFFQQSVLLELPNLYRLLYLCLKNITLEKVLTSAK